MASKSRDTMANLVWPNSYISGYAMHNSEGIIICFILVCVYLLHH